MCRPSSRSRSAHLALHLTCPQTLAGIRPRNHGHGQRRMNGSYLNPALVPAYRITGSRNPSRRCGNPARVARRRSCGRFLRQAARVLLLRYSRRLTAWFLAYRVGGPFAIRASSKMPWSLPWAWASRRWTVRPDPSRGLGRQTLACAGATTYRPVNGQVGGHRADAPQGDVLSECSNTKSQVGCDK